jgi:DNA helicase-2/ATP-dependent DNA helicase PcrA
LEEIGAEFIEVPRKVGFHPSDHHKFKSGDDIGKKPAVPAYNKDRLKKISETSAASEDDKAPFEESDSNKIITGMQVEHQRFGQGKVISIEGYGPSRKATVFFPAVGQKQLLLKFARLRIIE